MSVISFIIALVALIMAALAISKADRSSDRADDSLRYLMELKNRLGGDNKELFRELYRIRALQLKAAGKLDYAPYEITDACIACGACEPECPEGAIRPGEAYRIIPELCSACGSCAEVCPIEACVESTVL